MSAGSPSVALAQSFTDDIGLRQEPKGSALPKPPSSVSDGRMVSRLTGSLSLRPVELLAPLTDLTGHFAQPTGTFTLELSASWSPFSSSSMTTVATERFHRWDFHPLERQLASLHRLEHPMVARPTLQGYVTHETALTEGPMEWIDLHGRHHGQYWLFKIDHFHVDLQTVSSTFTGSVSAATGVQPAKLRPELSLEELVRRAKPAVVCLRSINASGSGFCVTETGIIATNAHVAAVIPICLRFYQAEPSCQPKSYISSPIWIWRWSKPRHLLRISCFHISRSRTPPGSAGRISFSDRKSR
jgi:hypothetical protein